MANGGKYRKLRGKLESFEKSEAAKPLAKWFAKVDAYKLEFIGTLDGEHANATFLAREYAKRDHEKRQMEDVDVPQLNIELEAISQLGVEAMLADGTEKIILAEGGYVRIDDIPLPSIKDKAAVMDWLIENGMEALIEVSARGMTKKKLDKLANWLTKEGIHFDASVSTQTIQALAKERALNGLSEIKGVGTPYMKTKLTVRAPDEKDGSNGESKGETL